MYILLNDEGLVVDTATIKSEVHTSLTWVEVPDTTVAEVGNTYVNNEIVVPEVTAVGYSYLRTVDYPEIGDQLDALFHAGVFPAEMAAEIQAVKDKYPK